MAKRVIRLEQDRDEQQESNSPQSRKPQRRRRRRWLGLLVGLLLILAVFLPQILANTPMGDWALRRLVPTKLGQVTIGSRSLAWWAPLNVRSIRLMDSQGELLAEVGQVTTRQSLWEIVTTGQLTHLDVDQAAGRLVWRNDGSNWEDYINGLWDRLVTGSSGSAMADLHIEFKNSQVLLESETDQQRWMMMDLVGTVAVLQNGNDVQIQTEGALWDARQNLGSGQFQASMVVGDRAAVGRAVRDWNLQCQGPACEKSTTDGGVVFTAQVQDSATAIGRSIARRYLPTLELNGLATGKVAGVSNYAGDYVFLQSPKVTIEQLQVGDQEYLAGDVIQQRRVDMIGGWEMNPQGFVFYDTRLSGDFGHAEAAGTANLEDLATIWQTRRLPRQGLSSSGEVDLAMLANQLQNTLQLREGLNFEDGDLTWQVFNRHESDGSLRMFVDAVARNLAGSLGGESLRWDEPVQLSVSVRDRDRPIAIENLKIASSFVTGSMVPRTDGGQVNFQCDFDRMKAALDQFFQLPPMTMQGRGKGQLQWDLRGIMLGDPTLETQLVLDLQNANLILPGVFELRDPNIAVRSTTTIAMTAPGGGLFELVEAILQAPDVQIQKGMLELQTGAAALAMMNANASAPASTTDSSLENLPLGLTVTLTRPVPVTRLLKSLGRIAGVGAGQPVQPDPVMEAELEINGPLEHWLAMVRPVLSGSDIALTGASRSRARLQIMDGHLTVANLNSRATQFGFRGYGTILQEPMVQLEGAFSYHYDSGLLHLGDVTLATATAVARATQTRFRMSEGKPIVSGDVAFRGNVSRLYQTYNLMYVASMNDTTLGQQAIPGGGNREPAIRRLAQPEAIPEYDAIRLVDFQAPAQPAGTGNVGDLQLGGEIVGTVRFERNAAAETIIHLESNLNHGWIGAIQPNGQLAAYIKEPVIVIKGDATLSPDANQLTLPNLTLQSHRMAAGIAGSVGKLMSNPDLQLQVRANADLVEWIRPFAGESLGDLQIDGLKEHQIQINGPIDLNQIRGTWNTQWQSIGWMGLTGGPANVVLNLSGGILKMQPVRFTAGGGQVNLAPEVDLRDEIVWVRLPRGVVFDEVQLTPKLCRNWLKYAAPLLAEVTSVQGTFSLDSDGIEVPLSNWTSMVAKARVTINGARVGPGPLGLQIGQVISAVKTVTDGGALDDATLNRMGLGNLSGLVNAGEGQRTQAIEQIAGNLLGNLGNGQAAKPGTLVADQQSLPSTGTEASAPTGDGEKVWLDIPQQTVSLNLQDGAIVHDRLKMSIKGFDLISQGRVGLDQSLAVDTQLNIPQEVLDKNPDIASALGPQLALPITGTLTHPTLQSSQLRTALNTAVSQGLQKAVGEKLEKKLGVPGLGELGNGSGNPLDGLIQQGQKKLGEQFQRKLGWPQTDKPRSSILPGFGSPAKEEPQPGTGANQGPDSGNPARNSDSSSDLSPEALEAWNQKLDKGIEKLFQ